MTISWPISIPDHGDIEEFTMHPVAVVGMAASPFTREQNVQRFPGQLWQANVRVTFMTRANAEEWAAFGLALNGREGTFLMGDPAGGRPRGLSAPASPPIVLSAGQTGDTLIGTSSAHNISQYLRKGDYLQLGAGANSRLYKLLLDANTDNSGVCSMAIWPSLRSMPNSGQSINVQSCAGLWRMTSNEFAWTEVPLAYQGIEFEAMEALP